MRRGRAENFESTPNSKLQQQCHAKSDARAEILFLHLQALARAPSNCKPGPPKPKGKPKSKPKPKLGPPHPQPNAQEEIPQSWAQAQAQARAPPQRTPQEEIPQSGENEEKNEKIKLALAQPGEHFPFPNASHLLQSISRLGGAATPPNSDLFTDY